MAQYCRYCNNLVTGNGTYCTLLNRELKDSYCKSVNKCKNYEFNEIDAYDNEKRYKPRTDNKKKGESQLVTKCNQLSMF